MSPSSHDAVTSTRSDDDATLCHSTQARALRDPLVRRFIRANLSLGVVATLPTIRLHRAGPSSGLGRLTEACGDDVGTPYWAYAWPGGICLAQHILAHPETVRAKRVLDLGTGGGLVAIAAAQAGAEVVVAADTDRVALVAAGLNAKVNRVALSFVGTDVTAGPVPAVDVILVGDLFYAPAPARRVADFLRRCHASGVEILVGDVGRAFLPRRHLRRIAVYPVTEFGESDARRIDGFVYAFDVDS